MPRAWRLWAWQAAAVLVRNL
ncbi:hypothetical protein, partial [Mesorhizobium sp.]